jgi:hypothetical protein
MDHQGIIDEILLLLTDRGVVIRRDSMGGGGGGPCKIKDKKLFFYDTDSGSFENAINCARAAKMYISDLDDIYIKPAVREFIDKYTSTE